MYRTHFTYLDRTTVLEATFEGDLELDVPLLEQLARTARMQNTGGFSFLLVAENYFISPTLIALSSRFRLSGLRAMAICCRDEEVNEIHRRHLHNWFPSLAVECFPDRTAAMNWLRAMDHDDPVRSDPAS